MMLTLSMSFSYFVKPAMKNYGSQKFNNDMFLTAIGGIAFVASAIAKFMWGALQDKFGFFKVYLFMLWA
jgi:hypothetical protein